MQGTPVGAQAKTPLSIMRYQLPFPSRKSKEKT
jgi:hypothetical protein